MPGYKAHFMSRLSVALLVFAFFLAGCAKNPTEGREIAAYVNNDVIYKSDLKSNLALRAQCDPTCEVSPNTEADQLDSMIDRKIIVQYAMEKGLARNEKFVAAIRNIWEHALIRDFMEYQNREFRDHLFATDDDIKNYYENMSYKVIFKIFKSRDKSVADAAYGKYLKDKDTTSWQLVGPLAYDDIGPIALLDAFSMGEGEAGRFSDEPNYFVIEVAMKEKLALAPLDTLRGDIEKGVIAIKEKRLFEDWLKERRKHSKIRINTEKL